MEHRLEKAQSKGFHVDIDWSKNLVRPREWWLSYPFLDESEYPLEPDGYSIPDSASAGQKVRYGVRYPHPDRFLQCDIKQSTEMHHID